MATSQNQLLKAFSMKQIGLHNDGMKNTAITQQWSPTTDTQCDQYWPQHQ